MQRIYNLQEMLSCVLKAFKKYFIPMKFVSPFLHMRLIVVVFPNIFLFHQSWEHYSQLQRTFHIKFTYLGVFPQLNQFHHLSCACLMSAAIRCQWYTEMWSLSLGTLDTLILLDRHDSQLNGKRNTIFAVFSPLWFKQMVSTPSVNSICVIQRD